MDAFSGGVASAEMTTYAKRHKTRRRVLQKTVSAVLTLAMVFSIIPCVQISAGAASDALFGELNEGCYTLENATYQLTDDFAAEGYLYVPSGVTATIDLNGFTLCRDLTEASETGCVILNDGILTIEDSSDDDPGLITGGYALSGGAVYNTGTLTITGGTITGNCAESGGSGVFVLENSTINLQGAPVVKGNPGGNLWLNGAAVIHVTGDMDETAQIDVSADNMPRAVTTGFQGYMSAFTFGGGHTTAEADDHWEIIPNIPTNAITVTTWNELKNAVAANGAYIVLQNNITNTDKDSSIHVSGKTVTVDLCGHTVDVNRKDESAGDDYHFMYAENDAVLTVMDSFGGGTVKNGSATSGGAFDTDDSSATLNLFNITMTDNKASENGGAVRSRANLHIDGCIIKNNSSSDAGGAICAEGTVTLNDSIVTNNSAATRGGGVYLADYTDALLNLNGGRIENNACVEGGGVHVSATAEMNVSGAPVVKNNKADNNVVNNIRLTEGATLAVSDSLSNGAQIGITSEYYDRALVTGLASQADMAYFTMDETSDSNEFIKTFEDGSMVVTKVSKVTVSSWADLQAEIDGDDHNKRIVLGDNITANSDQTCIRISDGDNIVLDLNGKTLDRACGSKDENGHVIEIHDGVLTVRDSEGGGSITGGWAEYGGGIIVEGGGALTLESGNISGNRATNGGGVYVADNAGFTMSGGTIDSNIASQDGGGIFADHPVTVTGGAISENKAKYGGGCYFDMQAMTSELSGVAVSGNTASENGGGIYVWRGTVTLGEGVINENTAKNGGGVYVVDTCAFTASGAAFTKNKATRNGGAVYNDETLTLTSCTVTENEAEKDGGGVYNCDTAVITDCTFHNNKTSRGDGGAINQHDGSMLLDGGEITENTAANRGGGVYVDEESDNDKFRIKGDLSITDNDTTDLYLAGEELVKLADALSDNALISVSLETISVPFTKGFYNFHPGEDPAAYFTADGGYSIVADRNGEAMVIESDWSVLKKEIEGAADNATVVLERDWTASENDKTIEISADKHLTLDLNGHTIDANEAISGSIFDVKGTMTIKDSSAGQTGKLTGGSCTRGSAVYIFSGAELNLESGSISGNTAAQDGGGIYVNANGTLNISGGTVSDNSARFGAGVCNNGTATVTGGTITGNRAEENGGGIWSSGTLNLKGGSITGNVAVKHAGGVYIREENSSVLNVKEEPVIENNQSPIGNNILLCGGKTVTITDSLYPTAKLDVVIDDTTSPITSGYSTHDSPSSVFTYNGSDTAIEEKNGELYLKQATGNKSADSWTALQDAINNSSEGDIIVLTADAVCTNNTRLNVENKTVTIELNGHKIDRTRTSSTGNGQVFGVMGNSHLTITDLSGTGVITGGFSQYGGGFYVDTNATLTINGGSVQGNTADSTGGGDGGGVYNKGTLIMNGGAIAFNKADDTGGGIYSTSTGTIQLNNALITGNYADDDIGGGMNIHLKDNSSYIKNSYITNNTCADHHGGGISMDAKGKTLLIEATHIEGNTASDKGGGIYITEGKIEINDSFVNKNTSGNDGGAVYGEDGTTLIATNTEFNKNAAVDDGGAIESHGAMTLTGCTVKENTARDAGGGICFDSKDKTLELTDTRIDDNKSSSGNGGGICVSDGSLTITRGSVSRNRTESGNGSAIWFDGEELNTERVDFVSNCNASGSATVCLQAGEAQIKGGTFLQNFVKYDGGGVFVAKNAKLYVEAAAYTEGDAEVQKSVAFVQNHAGRRGGAIFLRDGGFLYLRAITVTEDDGSNGAVYAGEELHISGKVMINSGLYLEDDAARVCLDGALEAGSHIDVELGNKTGSFTDGFRQFHEGEDPDTYFSAQEGYAVALDKDGEVKVKGADWATLRQMIDNAENGSTITLTRDYKADDADESLVIPENKTLTLDLHGYKLDGAGKLKDGTVLKVGNNAKLTIEDNYEFPNNVEEEFRELYEGVITGGTASAIVNRGELTIRGGRIMNNTGGIGGGINNYGTLTITGGRIKSNAAADEGGGIHNSGTLNLYGGEIKNNVSASSGGGVFCGTNSHIYVKDAPKVKENNGAAGKNIVLSSGVKITLNGALDTEAKLDVALKNYEQAITNGYVANGSPQGVFSYNEDNNIILAEKNGELYFPYTINVDEWVGTWVELQQVINNAEDMPVSIGLSADLTTTGQQRIVVEDGRDITIELAGHTMNRGFTSKQDQGNVFKVTDNDTQLTIQDTLGTGVITGGYVDGNGGGFCVGSGAKLTIEGGTVYGNSASSGGGIYVDDDAELVMTGGAVSGNCASDKGGGIYTTGSAKITLENADISLNTAGSSGGGMYLYLKENAAFTGCTITDNEAQDKDGGGLVMNAPGKTLTLYNCKVDNNTADFSGGGIDIEAGTVEASRGEINTNKADCGGGVYVSGGCTFRLTDGAVIANNRTTGKSGGGIACYGDLVINSATVELNDSAKYGGGVFYQNGSHVITLTDAGIIGNEALSGGGLYIGKGGVVLSGGKISANTSSNGGGVFVTEDAGFTANHSAEISENLVTSSDGGGIVNKGETNLENMIVKDNTAKNSGGGIRNDGSLTVKDCTIDGNKAALGYGGGIAHMDGAVRLEGANLIQNNQSVCGGGVYVEQGVDGFCIEGTPVVTENSGGNVYLYKEVITLNGALGDGARISVSNCDDTGIFTKDFNAMNSGSQPSTFFISDCAYEVYLDGGEAALRGDSVEDTNPFIDRNDQIVDSDKVGGRNWMSAVSGERRLNELNLIRAHDAAMNNTKANVSSLKFIAGDLIGDTSGFGRIALAGASVSIPVSSVFEPAMLASAGGPGTLAFAVSQAYKAIAEEQARTQYHYIDELMDMGVRVFDLRVNNKNWEEPDGEHDDNVNLWLCSVESGTGVCIYGCGHDGSVLSVHETLEWAKEFLKNNPTEVLFFEFSPETQDNDTFDTIIASRLKKILKEFSYEINPSTGKSYLYMEDGVFGKDYTAWPKLRDVRGQIVYTYDNATDGSPSAGGYSWTINGTSPYYGCSFASDDNVSTPADMVDQTEAAAAEHPSPNILTDAMVHRNVCSGYYANMTAGPNAVTDWIGGKLTAIPETPLELEEKVLYGSGSNVNYRNAVPIYELHYTLGTQDWYDPEFEPGYEGILREGGVINQKGEYYGVFSLDGVTEKEARMCWSSNFYDGLEYCTVTVKSGLDGDDTVKAYKVLKGTAITIPNCIYEKPSASDVYFQNWHAATGENNNWTPSYKLQDDLGTDYTGRDNKDWLMRHSYEEQIDPATQIAQNTGRDVMPGETITIMDDTEFTAVWGSSVKTPVTVVWNDGDDGDGLRTDRLAVTYQIDGSEVKKTAVVEESSHWSTMLSGNVLADTLAVNWNRINANAGTPHGEPVGGYSYEATGDINSGITITMCHAPQMTVTPAGVVSWDDNSDARQIRGDSVTVKLIKNGDVDNPIDTVQVTEADGWAYDFGTFPVYTEKEEENGVISYQREVYSIVEDPVRCYTASYDEFDITNVYIDPDIAELIVEIDWQDAYNSYGERPGTVTLHLWDGDTEIDEQVVSVDDEEAATLTYFDVKKYEMKHLGDTFDYHVTLDEIPNYQSVESNETEGDTLVIVNTFDNVGKYIQGHSLSLNGNIGVNFYLKLTEDELSKARIHFEWFDKELDVNGSDLVYNAGQQLYKATCPVAVAEMNYNVNATLYIDGEEAAKDRYSVVKYANFILSDEGFYNDFIANKTAQLGDVEKAKEKYSDLLMVILTMLDYGSRAQLAFDRDTDHLADGAVSVFKNDVTSDMIDSKSSDMTEDLDEYGLEYVGSAVVYLSQTSLRHYYTITDRTLFNAVKDEITFNGEKVTYKTKSGQIYFELKNISAGNLSTQYVLRIGEKEYRYSVLDYMKACLDSTGASRLTKELVAATYRYNRAATAYFN